MYDSKALSKVFNTTPNMTHLVPFFLSLFKKTPLPLPVSLSLSSLSQNFPLQEKSRPHDLIVF